MEQLPFVTSFWDSAELFSAEGLTDVNFPIPKGETQGGPAGDHLPKGEAHGGTSFTIYPLEGVRSQRAVSIRASSLPPAG